MPADETRLDVWLVRARLFKTRALACKAVALGVLVERAGQSRTVTKPGLSLCVGDGLSLRVGAELRTVQVAAFNPRRGPAAEARLMYLEIAAGLDDGEADAHQAETAQEAPEQEAPEQEAQER